MKIRLVIPLLLLLFHFKSSFSTEYGGGSYGHGWPSSDYPAAPTHHSGNGHHQSAGSYYHYHVPLVGQHGGQGWHHQPAQSNDHHYLWPLLILLALPLLLLPLLPLFLIPIGISLLALLLPLLMGGMMMMMMMMPMMMPTHLANRAEVRAFGNLVLNDMTQLFSKYARGLDIDNCPERIVCEMGDFLSPVNSTNFLPARRFVDFIIETAVPKGNMRSTVNQCKEAFWSGMRNGNCSIFSCNPVFRIFKPGNPDLDPQIYFDNNLSSSSSNILANITQKIPNPNSKKKETMSMSKNKQNFHKNFKNIYKTSQIPDEKLAKIYASSFSSSKNEINEIAREKRNENDHFYPSVFGTPTMRI